MDSNRVEHFVTASPGEVVRRRGPDPSSAGMCSHHFARVGGRPWGPGAPTRSSRCDGRPVVAGVCALLAGLSEPFWEGRSRNLNSLIKSMNYPKDRSIGMFSWFYEELRADRHSRSRSRRHRQPAAPDRHGSRC